MLAFLRHLAVIVFAALITACGSDGGPASSFEVDPSVVPGMNPYTFSWEPTAATEGDRVARERGYLLYVPDEYLQSPGEAWPLVLFLHGAGPPADLTELALVGAVPAVVQSTPYRFIMAAPLAADGDFTRPNWAWFHSADYLRDFVDHVATRVNVDPDRIYVTGVSWGAMGAWALAAAHPDLPAALITVAGGWNDRCVGCGYAEDWTEQVPDNVCDMKDIPIWVFHGDADKTVDWESSQVMVDALRACDSDVRFTLQEGVGHNFPAFEDPALYEWMLEQGSDGDWPALPSE